MRCLIYLIWKTLHYHGIFGSNAQRGVLEYVDHCFRTTPVPYLSLIFLLRYIVGSPLFLVIYGSKLTHIDMRGLFYCVKGEIMARSLANSRVLNPVILVVLKYHTVSHSFLNHSLSLIKECLVPISDSA